jgi:hypothetical protein
MLLVGQKIVLSLLFLSDSNMTLAKGETPFGIPRNEFKNLKRNEFYRICRLFQQALNIWIG